MIEKNIVDRVPTHPGRIKLTPVEGQTDLFDVARADDPTVEGTPLDKATLDSIIQSRLTGRYYMLNVNRTYVGASSDVNANPIPASGWVHNGFALSVNGNYVARVNEGYGNYPGYAFDGDNDTSWVGAQDRMDHWISIELPNAITAKKVLLKVQVERTSYEPTIRIEGSNNNTSWNTLLTITGAQSSVTEYALTTTGEYKYYRMHLSYTGANTPEVYAFGITQYVNNQYNNNYSIDNGVPLEWSGGQRITVQVPASASSFGVVRNTLNGVNVNTILQGGRRYDLRYNGTSFDGKEV